MTGKPTMRDVARAAGVSAASVSLALNNKGRLDAATRDRIIAAAERLGYQVHREARALRTGRTMSLGLITSLPADQAGDLDSRLDWYTRTAFAAAGASLREGYALVLVPPDDQRGRARSLAVDGALLIDPDPGDGLLDDLRARGLPTVVLGGADPGVASASLDRRAAVALAMSHLLAAGARVPALLVDGSGRQTAAGTRDAYLDWCRDAGLEPLVATADLAAPGGRTRAGQRAFGDLLAARPDVDGVYAPLDSLAAGVLAAARERGVAVPGALRVVTADGPVARHADPPLTAIDTRREEQAVAAVRMLISELRTGVRAPSEVFTPALVVR
ncbi:LacI family DNA-binding transcriptional regulator [Actinomadura atramentaria]|uniref:LacI family DNA-binding transcriptional regulator n=1 Tax=Actinomadura atramentaria TaxID=1990 RepID=UPI00036DCDD3|nr:LacI family DNA-binding transcriptional regulator [Actinomadura atramentaria]